ncbi:MAG: ABC transporter ATP-binding protein [Archangiaceae bacterium]|nr:ABC transporter ATP-binding protein [Archangiaceae bacterium]
MISVEGLTKYYGERPAIKDLAFQIAKGEVIGFLGLNGAGKSTTLKVLGCVLAPTSGKVTVDGYDVGENPHEIRKRIGYLPDTPPVYDEMTVGGYLDFVARLRGVKASDARARVKAAEAKTSLTEWDDAPIFSLSHGYRQRVGVAQALVHNPQLLILDEPTGGLDPVQIVEMRELIKKLKGEHTILLSSHILPEISQICDRLLIIHDGQIVAQGTEDQLAAAAGAREGGTIDVEVQGPAQKAVDAAKTVKQVSAVEVTPIDAQRVSLRIQASADVRPEVVRALVQANVDVFKVAKSLGRLESIFMKFTQETEAA